jgi:phage baseplate assembly protein gpV
VIAVVYCQPQALPTGTPWEAWSVTTATRSATEKTIVDITSGSSVKYTEEFMSVTKVASEAIVEASEVIVEASEVIVEASEVIVEASEVIVEVSEVIEEASEVIVVVPENTLSQIEE